MKLQASFITQGIDISVILTLFAVGILAFAELMPAVTIFISGLKLGHKFARLETYVGEQYDETNS